MGYKVIKAFTDLQDGKHIYRAGDIFPRPGVDVGKERLDELSTAANMRKEKLIEPVDEPVQRKKRQRKNAGTGFEGN